MGVLISRPLVWCVSESINLEGNQREVQLRLETIDGEGSEVRSVTDNACFGTARASMLD